MKSSTLHRSNLTKERMSMLENVKFQASKRPSSASNQYIGPQSKANELDVLYRSIGKSLSAGVSAATMYGNKVKAKSSKNPGVYLGVGFLGGAVFLIIVSLVVWISSIPSKSPAPVDVPKTTSALEVVTDTKETVDANRQEKYIIKSGDTLDKIAYRFYGKYDVKKIEEIKRINNITNPEGLQIGQVLIIPLGK